MGSCYMLEYVLGSRDKRVVVPSLCNVLVGEIDITQIVTEINIIANWGKC